MSSSRLPAGNQEAEAGQMVKLTERPGECGLTAVVGAGDHEHPLGSLEVEVIADDGPAVAEELGRQRDVERVGGDGLLGVRRHLRITERKTRGPERGDQLQVGQIQLHFAIEARHGRVEILAVSSTETRAPGKVVRMQFRHLLEDLRLHVVHLGKVGQSHAIATDRPLPEPRKRLLNPGGVVGIARVIRDGDAASSNVDRVPDRGQ
jgi:hypothetical protein